MQTLWQDLRYGARMLLKQPGFTLIAVITLALGIGANTAIFSVVNAVVMRPLPFPASEQLVRLYEKETDAATPSEQLEVAPANFLDWQRQSRTLQEVAAWGSDEEALAGVGQTESVKAAFVSANFFSVLGVSPWQGRGFTPTDDQPGHDSVAVLSFGLWQRRFGGAANTIGQQVQIDGSAYTVIGIMPAGFEFPRGAEIWTPLALNANQTLMREAHFLQVIARRRAEASLAQVRTEMETIADALAQQYPATNKHWTVNVIPLLDDEVGQVRPTMLLLLGAVGLVLALWGMDALLALSPAEIPRLQTVSVDARVLGFTLALTLLTGLLFGLVPALQAASINLHESLKESGRGTTQTPAQRRIFSALVVAELARSPVLPIGAGLLSESF